MAPKRTTLPAHRIRTLAAGTRAKSDAELVRSWADSLRSPHSRRNFEKTALRFLDALPAGIRKATVEDVREALATITEGLSDATAQQYVLRVKSLLSYGHKLGYMPFNAGVTIKIRPNQSRGQLAKRIMPEVDVKLLIRAARSRRDRVMLETLYAGGLRICLASSALLNAPRICVQDAIPTMATQSRVPTSHNRNKPRDQFMTAPGLALPLCQSALLN